MQVLEKEINNLYNKFIDVYKDYDNNADDALSLLRHTFENESYKLNHLDENLKRYVNEQATIKFVKTITGFDIYVPDKYKNKVWIESTVSFEKWEIKKIFYKLIELVKIFKP